MHRDDFDLAQTPAHIFKMARIAWALLAKGAGAVHTWHLAIASAVSGENT
jgi:hypothetical protein